MTETSGVREVAGATSETSGGNAVAGAKTETSGASVVAGAMTRTCGASAVPGALVLHQKTAMPARSLVQYVCNCRTVNYPPRSSGFRKMP